MSSAEHAQDEQAEQGSDVIADSPNAIVFFDGVCGLCNGTVNFLMDRDNSALKFAPLQGATAESKLASEDRDLDSIVFWDQGRTWRKSSAIVRILKYLKAPWPLLGTCLWLIPKPLRDVGYTLVAKLRYRLFGKLETCRMPTEADRGRILE